MSENEPLPQSLPHKPDSIEAVSLYELKLIFHSSKERNEVYEWFARLDES